MNFSGQLRRYHYINETNQEDIVEIERQVKKKKSHEIIKSEINYIDKVGKKKKIYDD